MLVIGFLYALPNIYPTQPSIQVAYTDSGLSADQALLDDLENILEDSKTVYDEIFPVSYTHLTLPTMMSV